MDVITCNNLPSGTRSLRMRTNSRRLSNSEEKQIKNEIQLCPSVMSEHTKKMLPPNSERIQTKPFPVRGIN
uniref:CSON000405 protein n=1 Tax=Culicoides sonorensis TaxID=179676 RepID=A0A336K5E0_CULSO